MFVGLSALFAGSWLVGAVAHVDDGHAIDHVAGSWMSLASAANAGTFYPPLYDGGFYGGTRFAPLPIALQAGSSRITGEYLVSAKSLSLVLAVVLVALAFVAVRRIGRETPLALLLASTLLVSGTGLSAANGIRNDALPVILQLGALALIVRSPTRTAVVGAGLLCALALASKFSAVWAPFAIFVWLLRRNRRRAAEFSGGFVCVLLLVFGSFEALSAGRMSDNVLGLAITGTSRVGDLGDQFGRLRLIGTEGLGALVVLLLLAFVGTAFAARRRQLLLEHVALMAATVVTAFVLLDPGSFLNHLLDVQVLALPVVAELWHRSAFQLGRASLARLAIAAVVVVGSVAVYIDDFSLPSDLRTLLGETALPDRVPRLSGVIAEGETILSEDPSIPVLRGERPIVLDPYMLIAVGDQHPGWRDELVARIGRAEFDTVVLLFEPGTAPSGTGTCTSAARSSRRSRRVTDPRRMLVAIGSTGAGDSPALCGGQLRSGRA